MYNRRRIANNSEKEWTLDFLQIAPFLCVNFSIDKFKNVDYFFFSRNSTSNEDNDQKNEKKLHLFQYKVAGNQLT